MSASTRRPALPTGLVICDDCGEPRGQTPTGGISVCYCQGIVCNWCGEVRRRPISDYFTVATGWLHVPWFSASAHRCRAPRRARVGTQWTIRPADDALRAYSEAVSRLAFEPWKD